MKIDTFKIKTGMGSVSTFFGHPLAFLTEEEKKEFDAIGYSGKNSNNEKISWTEYLNTLDKGFFKIEQTKYDRGDFSEEYLVIRVTQ